MGVVDWVLEKKSRNVAYVAGGMAGVLFGRKVIGLALFAKGLHGLERCWRDETHFDGDFAERWKRAAEFYEATHKDPVNRALHVVGIPMIVGGAAGLLAFPAYRPMWLGSAGWFTAGWVLNFIGHGFFEKNAPAFADDPLAFVAGPMWDLTQLRQRLLGEGAEQVVIDAELARRGPGGANGDAEAPEAAPSTQHA